MLNMPTTPLYLLTFHTYKPKDVQHAYHTIVLINIPRMHRRSLFVDECFGTAFHMEIKSEHSTVEGQSREVNGNLRMP